MTVLYIADSKHSHPVNGNPVFFVASHVIKIERKSKKKNNIQCVFKYLEKMIHTPLQLSFYLNSKAKHDR